MLQKFGHRIIVISHHVWPSMHKLIIQRKMQFFRMDQNCMQDAIRQFRICHKQNLHSTTPLLAKFGPQLCRHSLKLKRLVLGLLVNGVRIRNRKRMFLEMCIFNCITLSYLRITWEQWVVWRKKHHRDQQVFSKRMMWKTGFRCFAVNGWFMHRWSHTW